MADIQLLQHSVAPADVLLGAPAALEVLRRQRIEAVQGQYLPDCDTARSTSGDDRSRLAVNTIGLQTTSCHREHATRFFRPQ